MRRQFSTSDPAHVDLHDHVAWCGDGPEAFDRVAVASFAEAARRGELMLFVSEDPEPQRLASLDGLDALLDQGALYLATIDEVYNRGSDVTTQLKILEEQLDRAATGGHPGVVVVADCSPSVTGSDDEFADWLSWEVIMDQFHPTRPITEICFFDRDRVPADRLADLAAVHPVVSTEFAPPSFQLFFDGASVRMVGALETWDADRLRRILSSAPQLTEHPLDLSTAEYLDHRALLVLNEMASDGHPVRLRGAPAIVRRLWEILDATEPGLEFCE